MNVREMMMLPWAWPLFLMRKSTIMNDLVDIDDLVDITFQDIEIEYPGNRAVEKDVYSSIASPGTQLGILADAVLELANITGSNNGKEINRLKKMINDVNTKKKNTLVAQVEGSLKQMKNNDPDNFQKVLKEILAKID